MVPLGYQRWHRQSTIEYQPSSINHANVNQYPETKRLQRQTYAPTNILEVNRCAPVSITPVRTFGGAKTSTTPQVPFETSSEAFSSIQSHDAHIEPTQRRFFNSSLTPNNTLTNFSKQIYSLIPLTSNVLYIEASSKANGRGKQ